MSYFTQISLDPTNFDVDAGGSLRTSQRTTLGDYKFLRDKLPLLMDIQGTGTSTFAVNLVQLSVTPGQFVAAQSKQFHPYLAGKSQLIEGTFDNFQAEVGVTKRFGYYSSSTASPFSANLDGIFLQSSPTTVSVEVYKDGTTIVSAPQVDWQDKLDGSGASGLNVNWQNFNIIGFDFLYLGGSAVRFFIFYNGKWNLFYTFKFASTTTGTMIKSPNQPLRYEIVSTTGTGQFNMICCQVSTEGSITNVGIDLSTDRGVTGFSANTIGTTYAVVGVRKGANFRDAVALIKSAQVFINSQDQVRVDLLLNPTVAGVFTYSAITNSSVERALGTGLNTVTGGTRTFTGYNTQNGLSPLSNESLLNYLGCTLDGTMDSIVLCVTPISANVTVLGAINFKEII